MENIEYPELSLSEASILRDEPIFEQILQLNPNDPTDQENPIELPSLERQNELLKGATLALLQLKDICLKLSKTLKNPIPNVDGRIDDQLNKLKDLIWGNPIVFQFIPKELKNFTRPKRVDVEEVRVQEYIQENVQENVQEYVHEPMASGSGLKPKRKRQKTSTTKAPIKTKSKPIPPMQIPNQILNILPQNSQTSTRRPTFKINHKLEYHKDETQPEPNQLDRIITTRIFCTECLRTFDTRSELDAHLERVHVVHQFRCLVLACRKSFKQKEELTTHIQNHIKNIVAKKNPTCLNPIFLFYCKFSLCKFRCNAMKRIETHYQIYHERGHFKCGYQNCDYNSSYNRMDVIMHQRCSHGSQHEQTSEFRI